MESDLLGPSWPTWPICERVNYILANVGHRISCALVRAVILHHNDIITTSVHK